MHRPPEKSDLCPIQPQAPSGVVYTSGRVHFRCCLPGTSANSDYPDIAERLQARVTALQSIHSIFQVIQSHISMGLSLFSCPYRSFSWQICVLVCASLTSATSNWAVHSTSGPNPVSFTWKMKLMRASFWCRLDGGSGCQRQLFRCRLDGTCIGLFRGPVVRRTS